MMLGSGSAYGSWALHPQFHTINMIQKLIQKFSVNSSNGHDMVLKPYFSHSNLVDSCWDTQVLSLQVSLYNFKICVAQI